MGCSCHHDWLSNPHVLPLDLSMVLRRKTCLSVICRRHPTILVENVGSYCKGQLLVDCKISSLLNSLQDASPNLYGWKVYSGNFFFQLFLAWVMPGYQQEGLPVPSLGYKTLT